MGLLWKSVEPEVVAPQVTPSTPTVVSPLTQQEWDAFFDNHPLLQVNPSTLTHNVALVNEIRDRTLTERFAEIGRRRSRGSRVITVPLEEPELDVEFVVTRVSPISVSETDSSVNERVSN